MVSRNDGETSDESELYDFTDLDYAQESILDSDFCGSAAQSTRVLCRFHRDSPEKSVAFEGTNTGRRFYRCAHKNADLNCGFVEWVDPEWPSALKKTLAKLWEMYENVNNAKIQQDIKLAEVVYALTEEKKQLEKTCSEVADVNRCIVDSAKTILANKYQYEDGSVQQRLILKGFLPFYKEVTQGFLLELVQEKTKLTTELEQLKFAVECEKGDIMWKEIEWAEERDTLKEETKKLEFKIAEVLKPDDKNKDKLERIKSICDE